MEYERILKSIFKGVSDLHIIHSPHDQLLEINQKANPPSESN